MTYIGTERATNRRPQDSGGDCATMFWPTSAPQTGCHSPYLSSSTRGLSAWDTSFLQSPPGCQLWADPKFAGQQANQTEQTTHTGIVTTSGASRASSRSR